MIHFDRDLDIGSRFLFVLHAQSWRPSAFQVSAKRWKWCNGNLRWIWTMVWFRLVYYQQCLVKCVFKSWWLVPTSTRLHFQSLQHTITACRESLLCPSRNWSIISQLKLFSVAILIKCKHSPKVNWVMS